jgi:hypothetical protein
MISEKDVIAALPKLAKHVTLTVKPHASDYRLIQIYLHNTRPINKNKAHANYVVKCVDDDYKDMELLRVAVDEIVKATQPYGFFA